MEGLRRQLADVGNVTPEESNRTSLSSRFQQSATHAGVSDNDKYYTAQPPRYNAPPFNASVSSVGENLLRERLFLSEDPSHLEMEVQYNIDAGQTVEIAAWRRARQMHLDSVFKPETQVDHTLSINSDHPLIMWADGAFASDEAVAGRLTALRQSGDDRLIHECLVQDVLTCLMGGSGNFVMRIVDEESGQCRVRVHPSVTADLREMVMRCVQQIVPDIYTVDRFVNENSSALLNGSCVKIFAGAVGKQMSKMRSMIHQLECLVQMNPEKMDLLTIEYHLDGNVQQTIRTIARVVDHVRQNSLIGGGLITYLLSEIPVALAVGEYSHRMLLNLIQTTSNSYSEKLKLWMLHGQLDDIYLEFMIWPSECMSSEGTGGANMYYDDEDEQVDMDTWENRFEFIDDLCPAYLLPVKHEILKCGTYVNILRRCGGRVSIDESTSADLHYSGDPQRVLACVHRINVEIGRQLLQVLVQHHNILAVINTMQQFCLLLTADWLRDFMLQARLELSKPVPDVQLHRIVSLFAVAVSNSSLGQDPHLELLTPTFSSVSLDVFLAAVIQVGQDEDMSKATLLAEPSSSLIGFDGLHLSAQIDWPLNVLFTRRVLIHYTIVFRRLLQATKCIMMLTGEDNPVEEWEVRQQAQDAQLTKLRGLVTKRANFGSPNKVKVKQTVLDGTSNDPLETQKSAATPRSRETKLDIVTRHTMLKFVQDYLFYCTEEVIKPNLNDFKNQLKEACTLDQLANAHSDLLQKIVKGCLLTDKHLVKRVHQAFELILAFCRETVVPRWQLALRFTGEMDELIETLPQLGVNKADRSANWHNLADRINSGKIPASVLQPYYEKLRRQQATAMARRPTAALKDMR